ncbi:MAG TPA: nickel-responsive transcriptional regulator NikR [Gammaproteobacteria bacterium]|nr:nickel-responsive transcriptional regulator NikR [Gammaproteobacteria bacterium]
MANLSRFGVSIDDELLEKFDQRIKEKGYSNRSEAIRDLIRNDLVTQEWKDNDEIIGTLTIVYDHHTRDLSNTLTHLQHSFLGHIQAVLHIHLDHHNCLEVLVVKGKGAEVQAFADTLVGTRGVKHGKLTMTTTGAIIPSGVEEHGYRHER